ncbi:MAG: hypothetical protein KJ971_05995 [Firmicutes bacterium]|nr:hypothetical protein [Bacillota bacterium]
MDKTKLLFRMLFDNNALLKANLYHIILVVIIFFINISLICIPNYFGMMDGVQSIGYLEGINEAFTEMYDEELSCSINSESVLSCEEPYSSQFGDYQFIFQEVIDTTDVSQSTIFFGQDYIYIVYIDEENLVYDLSGDYKLLNEFDFSEIMGSDYGDKTKAEFYEYVTDVFLTNTYNSSIGDRIFTVYTTQFSQTLIYLMIVSIMFMIINYRAKFKKISYLSVIKILVLSMTGPALLTAVLGVFITAWASIMFVIMFAIRLMFVYYKVNKVQETMQ